MRFGQAYVARTAQAKASHPLRAGAFNPCSSIVAQGPVRLTIARSGRLQGLVLGTGSQLNGSAFHARALRPDGTGPAVLPRELAEHAGLAFSQRLNSGLRRMPLGASGLLRVPVHLEIRRRIPLPRQRLPLLVFPNGSHQRHLVDCLTLDEQFGAHVSGVDQLLRWP